MGSVGDSPSDRETLLDKYPALRRGSAECHGGSPGVDQWLAAIDDVQRRWPHNSVVCGSDERVDAALFDRMAEPWEELPRGSVDILWPGRAVPFSSANDIEPLVRATAPDITVCDRCKGRERPNAVLLVPLAPHLIAVSCCSTCWFDLNFRFEPLRWIFLTTETEQNHAQR